MGNENCKKCALKDLQIDGLSDALMDAAQKLRDIGLEKDAEQFEQAAQEGYAAIDRDVDGLPLFFVVLGD